LGVAQAAGLRQREPFGEGVDAASQLQSSQQRVELRAHRWGGPTHAEAPSSPKPSSRLACAPRSRSPSIGGCGLFTVKWLSSRANRAGLAGGEEGLAVSTSAFSVARSIIRPM